MASPLPVFQNTLNKTNQWLDEIMELLDWSDRQLAYKALRTVLQSLRDQLSVEEAADLAAQLPMLIRGIYFEGWSPSGKPKTIHKATDYLKSVNMKFSHDDYLDSEDITRAVLQVLQNHVSAGEINDLIALIPKQLRPLWQNEKARR